MLEKMLKLIFDLVFTIKDNKIWDGEKVSVQSIGVCCP